LAKDIGESFEDAVAEAGKTLRTSIVPDVAVLGDSELLSQALINLLENAIVHTPAGTFITIALNVRDGQACLSVCDNGPGVPAAEHEHIFKRFFRLERSRSSAGNGLGLAIVAAVAQLHGAQITVLDNEPGLNVTIRLPVYTA
jgi:signal transduction histidine kinase